MSIKPYPQVYKRSKYKLNKYSSCIICIVYFARLLKKTIESEII